MSNKIWLNGNLVNKSEAVISVFDKGVLYGDGCFEGIRVYSGRIFKLKSHIDRLFQSTKFSYIDPPFNKKQIEEAIRITVQSNDLLDGYVRPVITRGQGNLGLSPKGCNDPTVFIIADKISLYPEEFYVSGMPITVSSRPRISANALDPQIKSCNYLNNILAKQEALVKGFSEAIMLNADGFVAECTGDNIFLVKDGLLCTPSLDSGILNGITRKFIIDELSQELELRVHECKVKLEDLYNSQEVFLTGTAAEIIGVSRIDDHIIGSGFPGSLTDNFIKLFKDKVMLNAPEN